MLTGWCSLDGIHWIVFANTIQRAGWCSLEGIIRYPQLLYLIKAMKFDGHYLDAQRESPTKISIGDLVGLQQADPSWVTQQDASKRYFNEDS